MASSLGASSRLVDEPLSGQDSSLGVNGGPGVSSSENGPNKTVDDVLYSDIGLSTLLNRLRQSITSVQDFANFLQKRSKLEEEHAQSLKKLSKSTQEALARHDTRQGTYAQHFGDVAKFQDRLGDNGMQFALALHQMHEDLNELANNMERGRKHWKHVGLAAEKKAQDAESAMEKAKMKYDSLAEDYDRVKTGDKTAVRGFGLRGPKSAAQQEEDLHRKLQAADAEYEQRVKAAQAQRHELLNTTRPQAVKTIRELIGECDSALTMQLQRFATSSEKTLLADGLVISPIDGTEGPTPSHRSMRDLIGQIDNEKDFNSHILGFSSKILHRPNEIKYTPHSTMASNRPTASSQPPQLDPISQQSHQPPQQSPTQQYGTVFPGFASHPPASPSLAQPQNSFSQDEKSYDASQPYQQQTPTGSYGYNQGAGAMMQSTPSYNSGLASYNKESSYLSSSQTSNPNASGDLPPLRPVFGLSLDELFRRDGTAVPLIVCQCLQAVDLYGLDVEGIYRLSGIKSHGNALKNLFNHDSSLVDFRNPEAFFHDVNSVASLLKIFFKEMPDPLLTSQHYNGFIEAAKIEDDIVRRDSLHAIINELPDPSYATLRALVLHLNRVQEHSQSNRMSTSNLAICFAPTLMGEHRGKQVEDVSLQVRVIDTILQNSLQIFDED